MSPVPTNSRKGKLCYRFLSNSSTWSTLYDTESTSANFLGPTQLNGATSSFAVFLDTTLTMSLDGLQTGDEIFFTERVSSTLTDADCEAAFPSATIIRMTCTSASNSAPQLTAEYTISKLGDYLTGSLGVYYGICYNGRGHVSSSPVWLASQLEVFLVDHETLTTSDPLLATSTVISSTSSGITFDLDPSNIPVDLQPTIQFAFWPIVANQPLHPNFCTSISSRYTLQWNTAGLYSLPYPTRLPSLSGNTQLIVCARTEPLSASTFSKSTLIPSVRVTVSGVTAVSPTALSTIASDGSALSTHTLSFQFSSDVTASDSFTVTIVSTSSSDVFTTPPASPDSAICAAASAVYSGSVSTSSSSVTISPALGVGYYLVCIDSYAFYSLNVRNTQTPEESYLDTVLSLPITSVVPSTVSITMTGESFRNGFMSVTNGYLAVSSPALTSGAVLFPAVPSSSNQPQTILLSDASYPSPHLANLDTGSLASTPVVKHSAWTIKTTVPATDMAKHITTSLRAVHLASTPGFEGNMIESGDANGSCFIADGNRIRRYATTSISNIPTGSFFENLFTNYPAQATFGLPSGSDAFTDLNNPTSIFAYNAWVYVSNRGNNRVHVFDRESLTLIGSVYVPSPSSVVVRDGKLIVSSFSNGLYTAPIHCSSCTKQMTKFKNPRAAKWTVHSNCATPTVSNVISSTRSTIDQCRISCVMTTGCHSISLAAFDAGSDVYGTYTCSLSKDFALENACSTPGTNEVHTLIRPGSISVYSMTQSAVLPTQPLLGLQLYTSDKLLIFGSDNTLSLWSVSAGATVFTLMGSVMDLTLPSLTVSDTLLRTTIAVSSHGILLSISQTSATALIRFFHIEDIKSFTIPLHFTAYASPLWTTTVADDAEGGIAFASVRCISSGHGQSYVKVPLPFGLKVTPMTGEQVIMPNGWYRMGVSVEGALANVQNFLRSVQVRSTALGVLKIEATAGFGRRLSTQSASVKASGAKFVTKIALGGSFESAKCSCGGKGFCGLTSGGECRCTPPYMGYQCEMKACNEQTCLNGSICDFSTGSCVCPTHFSGLSCERFECVDNCNGRGNCIPEQKRCICVDGWEGEACEIRSQTTLVN
eukprot:GDKJ01014447.1.p1 GENE.GDKJ01014447.1~~GDKJ01014447.1.p1  ORF type:complete len:1243 (-),score=201.02 GDKJ01014447.1:101-3412(-)